MNLNELAQDESWMNESENEIGRQVVSAFQGLQRKWGLRDTPFLALRVRDLKYETLLLHRLIRELDAAEIEPAVQKPGGESAAGTSEEEKPSRKPVAKKRPVTPEAEKRLKIMLPVIEAMGKTMERIRKVLAELEEHFDRSGNSLPVSLADSFKPIIKNAERVYQESFQRSQVRATSLSAPPSSRAKK